MKEIILITTEGCQGCEIMSTSIRQAISLTKKDDICFKEYDIKDYKNNMKGLNLRDFPTTIFKRDGKITRKEIGTRPYIVVLRWIDIDFK